MDIKKVNRIIFVLTAEDNLPFCYESERGYDRSFKQECLTMYVNGMGFRAIERVKGVHNTTVMDWVKKVGLRLPDYYNPEQIPEVGELDELETFVGSKKAGASLGGSLPMKGAHKTQDLALDSSKSLSTRNFRVGIRRP
jgi:hypothetical protein